MSSGPVSASKEPETMHLAPKQPLFHALGALTLLLSVFLLSAPAQAQGLTSGDSWRTERLDLEVTVLPEEGTLEISGVLHLHLEAEHSDRIVVALNGKDALATFHGVQGPPGAGKTYTGARMICKLVAAGRKVGITAMSHKVIENLLETVQEAAAEYKMTVDCVRKVGKKRDDSQGITEVTGNGDVLEALQDGTAQVGAGTAWLWAREECREMVDVLFVDEAGQMSLANVLAAAQGARSLVLLGDPQQLEQPQQGSHPEGTHVSALEHLLGEKKTIPDDRGLFLARTWRLHPDICSFTSELFYEGRLRSRDGLERQAHLLGEFTVAHTKD